MAADQFPADNDFVRKAEQAGQQQVVDAQAAINYSGNQDVRRVAQMILRNAATANQALVALAVEKGWPSPTLDPSRAASGYSDHTYVSSQIRTQQEAIAFYAEEATNGVDTDLQTFARDTLVTLRHRLASLRSLRSI